MTAVCYEMIDSMSGSVTNDSENGESREVKRRFLIGQCQGFNDAVSQIEEYVPQYVESDGAGLYWRRSKLDVNGVGNKYFDCSATYATLLPKQSSESNSSGNPQAGSIAWDTTGHTEHITQSLQQAGYPEGSAPNFDGAINVSGTSVNGIDVVRPNLRYSETWILPASLAMSSAYIEAVYTRTGTVNLNSFRSFKPGEALFMGGRGQWSGDQPYVTVTFDFECRPNGNWYSQGLGFQVPKEGWQYVWCLYETAASQSRLVQRPKFVYLETIYEKKSWDALQITATPAAPRQPARPRLPNAMSGVPFGAAA